MGSGTTFHRLFMGPVIRKAPLNQVPQNVW